MSRRRDCARCYLLGLGTGAAFLWYVHIAGYRAGIRKGKLYAESPLDVVDAEVYCGSTFMTERCELRDGHDGDHRRDGVSWKNGALLCGAMLESIEVECNLRAGHSMPHESAGGHLWR